MVDPARLGLAVGIGVSLFFSAFFSMSETALLSASRTRLRYLADQGNPRARHAVALLQRPRRLLTTILIGNNIVNVVASVLATALAIELFGDLGLGIATGMLTLVLLLLGEITPKTFASEHSEWVSLRVARPIRFFVLLFGPFEQALGWVAKMILHGIGGGRVRPAQFHTEEEIKVLLKMGRERGHIGAHEAKLIRAVFEFNDLEIEDIMRPRPEVALVREHEPLTRVQMLVAGTGHSRFPVLEGQGNRPIGMVYQKDLLLMSPEQHRALNVGSIVRAMPRFPPNHRVTAALEKMQSEGSHMAAVVGEQGDLLGIVTIEDLLEEIVGDITDEYEAARRRFERERARLAGEASPPGTRPAEASAAAPARGGHEGAASETG